MLFFFYVAVIRRRVLVWDFERLDGFSVKIMVVKGFFGMNGAVRSFFYWRCVRGWFGGLCSF